MKSIVKAAAVQAAPAFLDLAAAVEKAVRLIGDAADKGAQIVVFPECWIPGYPWWVWLDSPATGMAYVARYHQNAPTANGQEMATIRAAAKHHQIMVVMGYSERAGGSLYIAQQIIDADGNLIAARRKLKSTHVERTVFGEGDGSDLAVHDTALGRVGALNCWEHLNPLNKYILYSQHEEIHAASWPSFSVYEGMAYALGPQLNSALSQVYAAEGQCFVIAACGLVSDAMLDTLCDTPAKRELLRKGGGAAMIFAPDGRPLADPLAPDEEGLVIADLDPDLISIAKSAADPVGHYSRRDVARVVFNPGSPRHVEIVRPPSDDDIEAA